MVLRRPDLYRIGQLFEALPAMLYLASSVLFCTLTAYCCLRQVWPAHRTNKAKIAGKDAHRPRRACAGGEQKQVAVMCEHGVEEGVQNHAAFPCINQPSAPERSGWVAWLLDRWCGHQLE
jgi:hypothetical protein